MNAGSNRFRLCFEPVRKHFYDTSPTVFSYCLSCSPNSISAFDSDRLTFNLLKLKMLFVESQHQPRVVSIDLVHINTYLLTILKADISLALSHDSNFILKFLYLIHLPLLCITEVGGRTLVASAMVGSESHGR